MTTLAPAQDRTQRPLDRTNVPPVPAAVADLWADWGYTGSNDTADIARALAGTRSIVNAMGGGDLWQVRMGNIATASTEYTKHAVSITSAALYDERLTLVERLAVTTGMAAHEAGHGRLSEAMTKAVARAWKDAEPADKAMALRLSNISEDNRLEYLTGQRWGNYADLFPFMLWWVAQRHPSGSITKVPNRRQAGNFVVATLRYAVHTRWGDDADLTADRAWWADWQQRMLAAPGPTAHVRLIAEGMAHIAEYAEPEAQPEQDMPDFDDLTDGGEGSGEPTPDADQPEPDQGQPADDRDGEDEDLFKDRAPDEKWDTDEGETTPDAASEDEADDEDRPEREADEDRAYGWDESNANLPEVSDPTAQRDEDEVDGLDESLPLHAEQDLTAEDLVRDRNTAHALQTDAKASGSETITVTHPPIGNLETTVVPVAVKMLETDRQRISTDPSVQRGIRAAFASRKTNIERREASRSGKFNPRAAGQMMAGSKDIFTRRDGAVQDRLDIHLLVDASGSMASEQYVARSKGWGYTTRSLVEIAAGLVANFTEGLDALPYARVHVWSHNTGYNYDAVNNGGDWSQTILWDVYDTRRDEPLGRIGGIVSDGGNNDASAVAALAEIARRERSPRERSVLVVFSDGSPCEDPRWVKNAVETARKGGAGVVSVAVAGGLTQTQTDCYGADNIVRWNGDWTRLTSDLAKVIGQSA